MKFVKSLAGGLICLFICAVAWSSLAQAASGCDSVNGTRFNLEPRLNAVPQSSESVAFLPNRVSSGVDLIVGAGTESSDGSRFAPLPANVPIFDAFYVHRSGTNCSANLEGTTFQGSVTVGPNVFDIGSSFNPTVIADPPRDAFFLIGQIGGLTDVVTRGTSATLLSSTACPNGTETVFMSANQTCWPQVGIAFFTPPINSQLSLISSYTAVDPRQAGTGAGDLYVVGSLLNTINFPSSRNIQIIACSNSTLICGQQPVVVSGTDVLAQDPWVQVREDGVITISYWTFSKATPSQPNPIKLRFVTCTPQGAPNAPLCSAPHLIATVNVPAFVVPGDNNFRDILFPKHVNRRESDGTFTTFLVYDHCRSIHPPQLLAGAGFIANPVCTKFDVDVADSTDNGATWSVPTPVETAVGHQYFGTIAEDDSTGTTNIAYYSTQNDPFLQHAQVFLTQIPAGSITPNPATALTSSSTDPNVGIQDFTLLTAFGSVDFGDRIGIAAAGTGTKGQSRVYVHYTWNNVFGVSGGTLQPDPNNTLVRFSY